MIYVALIRGISVGGNNKISMEVLKQTFEESGMESVTTYINSGNIIFIDDDHTVQELSALLEDAILRKFNLSVKVLIRTLDDLKVVTENLPEHWTNDKNMKSDVLFLWEDIDDSHLLDRLSIKESIDHVISVPGAVLWSVDKKEVSKSGLMKLAGSPLYKKMTIRNVNTARKLYALMSELAERTE